MGRAIVHRGAELTWRSIAERLVRMDGVVVLEPVIELFNTIAAPGHGRTRA